MQGEPALVMQTKPYRETSALVQCFARDAGRLTLVMRGARRKRSPAAGVQPFNEVSLSYSGRGGLMTLHSAEPVHRYTLTGNHLAGGFYVFELLARLLREHDGHPHLYAVTAMVIGRLHEAEPLAPLLRVFERRLLEELGFGIHFQHDVQGDPVTPDGFYAVPDGETLHRVADGSRGYAGATLLAIGQDDYSSQAARMAARKIFADALSPHLGARPLASRALLKRTP